MIDGSLSWRGFPKNQSWESVLLVVLKNLLAYFANFILVIRDILSINVKNNYSKYLTCEAGYLLRTMSRAASETRVSSSINKNQEAALNVKEKLERTN